MIKGIFSIVNTIKCSTANIGIFLVILTMKIQAQPPQAMTPNYISAFAEEAVDQMIQHKIPASVILAQAIFESGCGTSDLAKKSNNHFGIKCHAEWDGDTILKNDDSYNECFRSYKTVKESYTDHSLFLRSRPRYRHLFRLRFTDYRGWCYGLKNSGYATYAYYPEVLIKIIEQYELYEYDKAEILPSATLICSKSKEIIKSNLQTSNFNLQQFCANDLLWSDEKYILIQSLGMIIECPEKENERMGKLQGGTLMCFKNHEIIESKLQSTGFSLKELSVNDILWNDEKYLLIQSLEMIIDHPEKEAGKMAGK